jgi:hypothetical protein
MSYDDLTLITCSIDGSICIWKLTHIEGEYRQGCGSSPTIHMVILEYN